MRSKSEKQVRLLSSMLVSQSCLGKNSDLGNEPNCSALIEKIWLRSSSRGKIGLSGTGGDGAGASWEIPSHHHHSSLQMPFKRERIMDPLLLLNEFSNEWVVEHKVQLHLELIFHSSFLFLDPQKVTHLRGVLSYQNSSKKGAAARKVISSSALLLAPHKSQEQINLLIFFCWMWTCEAFSYLYRVVRQNDFWRLTQNEWRTWLHVRCA